MKTTAFYLTFGWRASWTFALTLLLAASLGAQVPEPEPDEGRGYLMIGIFGMDLDPLNAAFAERDLPRLSTSFMTLGGGGHARFGRFLVGAEGHGILSNDAVAGGFERSVRGGLGFVNAGYLLTAQAPFQIFPLVGAGAGTLTFRTVETVAPSFEEILDEPRRGATLTQTSFLMHAAVGLDYVLALGEDPEAIRGLTLGLRGGYMISLRDRGWRMEDFRVTGGPGLGLTGPYLRLSVGGVGPP